MIEIFFLCMNNSIMGVYNIFRLNRMETIAGTIVLGGYLEGDTIVFMFTLVEWLKRRSSDKVRLILL